MNSAFKKRCRVQKSGDSAMTSQVRSVSRRSTEQEHSIRGCWKFCANIIVEDFKQRRKYREDPAMAEPNTLNELRDLMQIGFGRRFPRHGLKLLYWFANNCVDFDDNNMMRWKNDRARGRFGFHLFINRTEDNDERLLPVLNHGYNYYEVGNLCRPGAEYLPYYVWAELNNDLDGDQSNMERIIFSVVDERIDRVYVTEHINESNFNREATFEISSGLIAIIKQLTLEEFLEQIDD